MVAGTALGASAHAGPMDGRGALRAIVHADVHRWHVRLVRC